MHDWSQVILDIVNDVVDGPNVPETVSEGLADTLGLAPDQVDEIAGELRTILSDEKELEAVARADSVDQVIESLSSLMVRLKG